MTKKVDIAGETYIVSEDVDFDQLDTENMIEKDYQPSISENTPNNKLKVLPSHPATEKKYELPILQIYLKFAKQLYVFSGEVLWADNLRTSSGYKLIMKNADAFQLHFLMLKTQGKFGNQNKRILFIKSILTFSNHKLFEFLPPKGKNGITSQILDRVKVSPKTSSRRAGYSHVEIDFTSIHWR